MGNIKLLNGISCEYGYDVKYDYKIINSEGTFTETTIETISDNSTSLIHTHYNIILIELSKNFKGKVIQYVLRGIGFSDTHQEVLFDNDFSDFDEFLQTNEVEIKVPTILNNKPFSVVVKGRFADVDDIMSMAGSKLDYGEHLYWASRPSIISQLKRLFENQKRAVSG